MKLDAFSFLLAMAAATCFGPRLNAAAPVLPVSAVPDESLTGNAGSYRPRMSADGRFVAFVSHASNLVTNDDPAPFLDVFVHNLEEDVTTLVSVTWSGIGGGNADAVNPVLSSNGQFVVFVSAADNLVAFDSNNACDVFLRDMQLGRTTLVSVDERGRSPEHPFPATNGLLSGYPLISAAGRWVAFQSRATNLVALVDTNRQPDVFARDLEAGVTHLVSVNTNGTATGSGVSEPAAFTPDGRFLAFVSTGTDLAPGVTNRGGDIYVRDLYTGQTIWASSNARGFLDEPTGGYACFHPVLSEDGRFVAFKLAETRSNAVRLIYHDLASGVSTALTSNTLAGTWPQISASGRFVAFEEATNVFVWDAVERTNLLINVALDGRGPADGIAQSPVMTPDGRRVLFLSNASNLADGVTNRITQIYLRELPEQVTRLVSSSTAGRPGGVHLDIYLPSISREGRRVAFESPDHTLVQQDENLASDVFVRDVTGELTRLVSRRAPKLESITGPALSGTEFSVLSGDGTRVAFTSLDGTLFGRDTNGWPDLFLRNLLDGTLRPIRAETNGLFTDLERFANNLTLSADGNYAVWVWARSSLQTVTLKNPGDVYWSDLDQGTLLPVNVTTNGELVGECLTATISPDARCVAFSCNARVGDLVPGLVGNGGYDRYNVFLRDMPAGTNDLVSVTLFGGSSIKTNLDFSPDGRWLLFASPDPDLTAQNISYVPSLFARDLVNRATVLVSLGPEGQPDWGYAGGAMFSGDAQSVAFVNTGLVVTVRNLGAAASVVAATNGAAPSISHDGRWVAFESPANGMGPTNILVADLQTGSTRLASVSQSGQSGNGDSTTPLLSADGRYVVFASRADNLVANDTNRASDIFARDLWLGTTLLISVNLAGTGPGNGPSSQPVLAANGRTAVFQSFASDLVPGDYNATRDVFVLTLGGSDTDGDGLDDDWELAYFDTLARNGAGDFDADGATDAEEFRAGTDPTNEGSVLRVLTVTAPGSGSTTVLWSAVPGRTYRVQYKDTVTDADWIDLPGNFTAVSSTGVAVDDSSGGSSQRFYRVLLAL